MFGTQQIKVMAELGFIAASHADHQNAIAIANGLTQLRSEHAIGYVIHALCEMNNSDWHSAEQLLDKGLGVEPNNETALMLKTLVSMKMGNSRVAKDCVSNLEALGQSPELALSHSLMS